MWIVGYDRSMAEPPYDEPRKQHLNENHGRKQCWMLRDLSSKSRSREHERDVEQVEHDYSREKTSRAAEIRPAPDAESELDDEVQCRIGLQVEPESGAPCEREESDVGFVLNDVQHDVRQNCEPDCGAHVCAPDRLTESPRQAGQENPGKHGMGVRQVIEMNFVGRRPNVFDAEVSEYDPQQLDELDGNEQRPETYSRISLLEDERSRGVAYCVRKSSSARLTLRFRAGRLGNSRAAEVILTGYSRPRHKR